MEAQLTDPETEFSDSKLDGKEKKKALTVFLFRIFSLAYLAYIVYVNKNIRNYFFNRDEWLDSGGVGFRELYFGITTTFFVIFIAKTLIDFIVRSNHPLAKRIKSNIFLIKLANLPSGKKNALILAVTLATLIITILIFTIELISP